MITKDELVQRIEEDYGIYRLFLELELENVQAFGGNVHCVCPFHEDADNPYAFTFANGFGFCFTQCRKKYSLFDIVMKVRECGFGEAFSFLCELIGEKSSYSSKKYDPNSLINRDFVKQMKNVRRMREKKEIIALDSSVFDDIEPLMHSVLRNEGFDHNVKDFFGLGFARGGFLDGRITIPIDYIDGTIISMSGRHPLDNETLREEMIPKYKLWKNTDKSLTLYNISRALPFIELTREVFVVEGFKSVWRMYQWGYGNVVAVMGSTISQAQRDMLLRLNCKIIVCGDKDEAGQLLNKKVVEECKNFANVSVLNLYKIENAEYKSSIDNVTKDQFFEVYRNIK